MPGTQVQFNRQVITESGVNKYEITASCLLAGSLPDTSIFVLRITNADDPKDDTLGRITDVQDFDAITKTRDTGITNGTFLWRSTTVRLTTTDLPTANEVSTELIARINSLIEGYDVYLSEFSTPATGELIVFPTTDPSTKTALKTAATAAATAVTTATETRDAALEDCNDVESEIAVLQTRITDVTSDHTTLSAASTSLSTASAAADTASASVASLLTQIRSLVDLSTATAGEKTAINAQVNSAVAQSMILESTTGTIVSDAASVASLSAVLLSRQNTLTAEQNAKVVELNACNALASKAQSDLDQARTNRQTALAAALAVCPDFTG